jgi:hypothetical protein
MRATEDIDPSVSHRAVLVSSEFHIERHAPHEHITERADDAREDGQDNGKERR